MPEPRCLACGKVVDLHLDTYRNYQGAVTYPDCKAQTNVVIRQGELISSFAGTNWGAFIEDLASHDIPVPILGDIAEAAAVLSINALKSCVVMCGRAMHGALIEKSIPDEMIGSMLRKAKAAGVITEDLYRAAIAANYFRVTGAHAKELREVSQTQALLTLEVTKDVLKHIFQQTPFPAWQQDQASKGSNVS